MHSQIISLDFFNNKRT